ncbi:PAAR domain-containing protein [Stenotrophomonas sp. 24(2023)]|uniref:PAAR domain-containing protein n=1 Tax=Stenotrophomonas sp. 24(2023) TaxID=3068324 RepID=UPI0027DFDA07|nr:PAAR domain-containing protein [Stenotrophomonas sp. 24(2023)]WMJ67637.1 PAAR domain-containing protein [Stenotrophomonas sp. 24(2023)]
MTRIVIVVGDRTTGGGEVLTGSPDTDINGMAIARVGDKASCPKHGGFFAIVTGDATFLIDGQPLARHGDSLACGCRLLANRQHTVSVASGGSGRPLAASAIATAAASSAGLVATGTAPCKPAVAQPQKQDILLHYHYGDLDRTPVRGVGYQLMLPDDRVVTGQLDDAGRARIPEVTIGPMQTVQVLFQPDVSDEDDAAILAARARLKAALDAIVAQTRIDMASEWRQWDEAGPIKRWGLQRGNQVLGAGQGAWDYVVGTVETAVDLAVLMYRTDREIKAWTGLVLTGDRDGMDRRIATLRAAGIKVMEAASESKELFNLLIEDPAITQLLPAFGLAWWEAVPPDEQDNLKARFGGQIMMDVVVSILLAAVTVELGGAGGFGYAAAKAGNTATRIGKRLLHLMEGVEDAFKGLGKALRHGKRRQADGNRRPDGNHTVETKRLPKRMPRKALPCFSPQKLPASKYPEMDRQLKGQEQGLNDMSVEDYLSAREAFDPKNRNRTAARQAREDFRDKLQNEKFNELKRSFSAREAKRLADAYADETMKTLNALHNPDLVAGGKDIIADFGDGEVNHTIGRQWRQAKKDQTARIQDLDAAARQVPASERRTTKMNGGLERCR